LSYGITTFNLPNDDHTFELRRPLVPFTQVVDLLPRDATFRKLDRVAVAIGSQVGRYPLGYGGNGYFPPVTGGVTTVSLGRGTYIDLDVVPRTSAVDLR
jgi:hypothetical protein